MFKKIRSYLNSPNQTRQTNDNSSREEVDRQIDEATRRAIKDYDKTFRILTEYDK